MSLNFDLTVCKKRLGEARYNSITTSPWNDKQWHPITDCLIWRTMAVGIGEISEKTIDEFCYRVKVLQLVDGPELAFDKGQIKLTRKDIENHIGLHTNVSFESRTKWLGRVFGDNRNSMKLAAGDEGNSAHEECNKLYDAQQAEKTEA